uniref:EF-hand domain-containing protein 1, related n=1 Tax=Neospora caninum (strain Liverpool) TaxID=572307 RepID=A0A0F7UCW6_NEOCL|nr:TPA: EF-hand domain-containing protein 1, related [Neospora caninum Liverpool]
MKNQDILDAQAIMAMSPPSTLKSMRQTAEHYRRDDFSLKQTLNYCLSGRVDLKRPEGIEIDKHLLLHMNAFPAWRLGEPKKDALRITHEMWREAKEERRLTFRPEHQPAWLKHDRQTLRFYAYFQEPVHDNPTENYRVRYCLLLFYLEDGTMQIMEPRIENSGLLQGAFLKRHRFPRPDGSGFFTMEDLKLSTDVIIYTRVFRIIDCDPFTKWFYEQCNLDVGQASEPLSDNFFENEVVRRAHFLLRRRLVPKDVKESREYTEIMLGGSRKNVGLKQHLDNDRKVLRFFCYWDDKTNYGMRSYYVIHYFLADDTVEILECYPKNSGKREFPTFLKPEDFEVGRMITVYNRQFHLYDCDDFTRDFYLKYTGLRQDKEEIVDEPLELPKIQWKPHVLGLSTEEDTLASCLNIAKLVKETREDEDRRFIISVRERDNTIMVFEIRKNNSGHVGGKFADAGKKIDSVTGKTYTAADFYIGAIVNINTVAFAIIDADERTLNHMQDHPAKYPVSDFTKIKNKISGVLHALKEGNVQTLSRAELQYHLCGVLLVSRMAPA